MSDFVTLTEMFLETEDGFARVLLAGDRVVSVECTENRPFVVIDPILYVDQAP